MGIRSVNKKIPRKELPKLIYGEGSFSYVHNRANLIRYEKRVLGKRAVVYGKTVQECRRNMKEKELQFHEKEKCQHPDGASYGVMLQDAAYDWLFTFKRPTLKGRSFDTIEGTYNNQLKDTDLGRTPILKITAKDVQEHINHLMDEKSESTAKKAHSLLKQFFDYYYARDINNNPMNLVSLPRKQVKFDNPDDIQDEEELLALSDDEIDKLTAELSKPFKPGAIGYSYGHMLLFVMWSFCRIGEVIALQYKDIDLESKKAKIYKAYGKEKVRDRKFLDRSAPKRKVVRSNRILKTKKKPWFKASFFVFRMRKSE